ncbi:MAG: hypothetical protein OXG04_12105 [Acidobacteria bacterium]|nr:hypothetical protein [Acidobacteriota bacterium]
MAAVWPIWTVTDPREVRAGRDALTFFERHLLQDARHPGPHAQVVHLLPPQLEQRPQTVHLGLLDRKLRVDGVGGHLQPFPLERVARLVLLLGRLRLLQLRRRDEALREELPVGVRLQAGRLELRFSGRKRRPLVEELALHLHLPVAVARLGRFEIQARLERGLFQLGIAQLEDHGVGCNQGARPDDYPFDGPVGGSRDPADLLRDQGAGAAHLPHHRAALHGVEVDGVAVDARRRRLQARDPHRDQGDHDERRDAVEAVSHPLLPGEIGAGDIHGKFPLGYRV